MLAEQELRTGNVEQALSLLQDQVRKEPNNPKYRVFLFQLLAVLGRWDRALVQLKVAGDFDPSASSMVQTYREALRCEVLRSQVFAAKKTPLLFGPPEPWMALLFEALALDAKSMFDEAATMRARAFEDAPTTSGTIDGQAFEWLADADGRLGPMLEAIINGRYYWVPFTRLRAIKMEAPCDLRDVVWTPAFLTLSTGAEVASLIPTRYPSSETSADPKILLARRTDWTDSHGLSCGLGQRCFVTDASEHALMDIRSIELNSEPSESISHPSETVSEDLPAEQTATDG